MLVRTTRHVIPWTGKNAPNALSPGQKKPSGNARPQGQPSRGKLLLATDPETAYIRFSDMDASVFFAFVAMKRTNSDPQSLAFYFYGEAFLRLAESV